MKYRISTLLIYFILDRISNGAKGFAPQLCSIQPVSKLKNNHSNSRLNPSHQKRVITTLLDSKQGSKTDENLQFINLDTISSSELYNAVKKNLQDGEVGSRGEVYFALQLVLIICILFGTVPLFGNFIELIFGPGLVILGGSVATIGVVELGTNLTPWPNPPKDGTLITDGILFNEIRHPIYAGLLSLMAGLSIWSGSAMRVLLCIALWYLLDFKSELEEEELIKKFGIDYIHYKERVEGKFIPQGLFVFFDEIMSTIRESDQKL